MPLYPPSNLTIPSYSKIETWEVVVVYENLNLLIGSYLDLEGVIDLNGRIIDVDG